MATCRTIVRRALQKLTVIAAGEEPDASEAELGLSGLQGVFDTYSTNGMFGRLDAFLAGALPSDVLEWALPEPRAPVELPIRIRDSNGDAVTPPDLSYSEYVDEATGERRCYLYDARRGAWGRIDTLTLDSECPLSRRGVEGIAAVLAIAICEDFGATPGPVTLRQAGTFQLGLSMRLGDTRNEGTAVYF